MLVFSACDPIVDEQHLTNSTDVAGVNLKVTHSTPERLLETIRRWGVDVRLVRSEAPVRPVNPLLAGLKQHPRKLEGRCGLCKYLDICNGSSRVRAEQVTGNLSMMTMSQPGYSGPMVDGQATGGRLRRFNQTMALALVLTAAWMVSNQTSFAYI